MEPRLGRRSEFEKTVSALADPKTPEEWAFALTNPYSPLFKLMMSLIVLRLTMEVVIIRLLEEWQELVAIKDKREREQLIRTEIADAIAKEENVKQAKSIKAEATVDMLKDASLEDLKKMLDTITNTLSALKVDQIALKESIPMLEKEIVDLSAKSKAYEAKKTQDFLVVLHESKTPVYVLDAKAPEGKRELTLDELTTWMSMSKSPVETINKVNQYRPELIHPDSGVESKTLETQCDTANYLYQIAFLSQNAKGEASSGAMLQWIKENKLYQEKHKEFQASETRRPARENEERSVDAIEIFRKRALELANKTKQCAEVDEKIESLNQLKPMIDEEMRRKKSTPRPSPFGHFGRTS